MNKITGAIFDLDGTLTDSMSVWTGCYAMVLKRYFKATYEDLSREMAQALDTAPITIGIPMLCRYFRSSISAEKILKEIDEYLYHFYFYEVCLKDGVRELLEHLYSKEVKMCVASASSPRFVQAAIKHCKIDPYFTKVFTCDEIGKSKETPDIYELAISQLNTSRKETWIFEDAVIAMRTAAQTGMPTVGIYDREQREQDEIRSLSTIYLAKGESHATLIPYFD